jgi:hypothetical protein
MRSADVAVISYPPRQREWTIKVPVMATDTREVDPKYGRPDMSPHDLNLILIATLTLAAGLAVVYALRNLLARSGHLLPPSSARADSESTDTIMPAVSTNDSHWRWARRIEADERIADAALRKEEEARMNALKQDG